jgi:hypothetical protein
MVVARSARSMLVQFLLHAETFICAYATAWFMPKTTLNRAFVYLYLAYAVLFTLSEVVKCNGPCAHRVKPIQWARSEVHEVFDPGVL